MPSQVAAMPAGSCSPADHALAEEAARHAAEIAEKLGLPTDTAAEAARRLALSRCANTQPPEGPLRLVAETAVALAKLGYTGTAIQLARLLKRKKSDIHAALQALAARQLAALDSLDTILCLPHEALPQSLEDLAEATREAIERLLAEHPKLEAARDPATGLPVAAYTRCPRCGAPLETRTGPAGCPRPGLRVEQRCPSCGWTSSYTVCKPPPCSITLEEGCRPDNS